jgi:hypothetical protein
MNITVKIAYLSRGIEQGSFIFQPRDLMNYFWQCLKSKGTIFFTLAIV